MKMLQSISTDYIILIAGFIVLFVATIKLRRGRIASGIIAFIVAFLLWKISPWTSHLMIAGTKSHLAMFFNQLVVFIIYMIPGYLALRKIGAGDAGAYGSTRYALAVATALITEIFILVALYNIFSFSNIYQFAPNISHLLSTDALPFYTSIGALILIAIGIL